MAERRRSSSRVSGSPARLGYDGEWPPRSRARTPPRAAVAAIAAAADKTTTSPSPAKGRSRSRSRSKSPSRSRSRSRSRSPARSRATPTKKKAAASPSPARKRAVSKSPARSKTAAAATPKSAAKSPSRSRAASKSPAAPRSPAAAKQVQVAASEDDNTSAFTAWGESTLGRMCFAVVSTVQHAYLAVVMCMLWMFVGNFGARFPSLKDMVIGGQSVDVGLPVYGVINVPAMKIWTADIDGPSAAQPLVMPTALTHNIALMVIFAVVHVLSHNKCLHGLVEKVLPANITKSLFGMWMSFSLHRLMTLWVPMNEAMCAGVTNPLWVHCIWIVFYMGIAWTILSILEVHAMCDDAALSNTGFHAIVRHPVMLGFLVTFWASPVCTQGHVLFAAFMTVFTVIGMVMKEKRQLVQFGKAFEDYRASVPMINPFGFRV